jgi:hypothetical protein
MRNSLVEPSELKALSERIIKSGELGRSRTYAAILEYLVEHAIAGTVPKEISIAMDVLGRESDFDVGKDSIVRVHIYHLRGKLNAYFARQGEQEKYRIDIPKGQYMLAVSENLQAAAPAAEVPPPVSVTGQPLDRRNYTPYLAAVAIALLLLNLWQSRDGAGVIAANSFIETPLWQPMLDDSLPILVLIGDYYIMGESDESGNIERMVREFDVNSANQLNTIQSQGGMPDYRNLDLGYAPTSTAKALVRVMQVLGDQGERVQVKMMSELSTNDLVGHHVIYLGYLSGLQNLTDLMFAASGLAIGLTYDELINLDTDAVYTSSSGLSVGEASYRDYGMLSSFPAPGGGQYLLLAGMRDEGLINLAEEVTDLPSLQALSDSIEGGQPEKVEAFEALYEVLGFDNTNFDANLVYSHMLDTDVLWETRLIGEPQR